MQAVEYRLLYETEQNHWWFRALRLFLGKFLPEIQEGSQPLALDVGCGTGAWMQHLAGRGFRVIGVDYSAVALDFARRNMDAPLVRASADRLPFAGSFDLLTSIDVLEVASVEPAGLAASAARALKPGGVGLIQAAAFQWLLSEHDRAVDSVHRFSLGELRRLFAGLAVQQTAGTYLYFYLFPFMALRKLFNKPKQGEPRSDVAMPAVWMNHLFLWVCKLEAVLLPWFRFPFGSSVLMRIKKND